MNKRINELKDEISSLKKQMELVEGTTTEVYSRIVGYYRSVKNWNQGKKEEYKKRLSFSGFENRKIEPLIQEVSPVTDKLEASPEMITGYSFFYRTSCPNCPEMKDALSIIPLKGDHLNVDIERGLNEATRLNVFSAPTVIFWSDEGNEVYRTCRSQDVMTLFNIGSSATA